MVLILIVGDLHFKKNNASLADLVIQKVLKEIKVHKPNFVVLLGDILDGHERIHGPAQNRACKFIKHIAIICPVMVVIGNHDRPNKTAFLTEDSCFYRNFSTLFH